MRRGSSARRVGLVVIAALACGCKDAITTVVAKKPAALTISASPLAAVTVGSSAGAFVVKVTDAGGVAMPGALVSFRITRGGGVVSPTSDTTDAAGLASATYTAGTFPGANDVSAFVTGVAAAKVTVTGSAGPARAVTFNTIRIRYTPTQDSALVLATPRDTFTNPSGTPLAWLARDPTLVSVTPVLVSSAVVRVLRRPGSTWVVASSGTAADSLLVVVTDSSSTPCSYIATPITIGIGGSFPFDGGTTCVRSTAAGAEYAVVAHLNTLAASVGQSISVIGDGVATPAGPFPIFQSDATAGLAGVVGDATDLRDFQFERDMRARERVEIGPRVAAARAVLGRSSLRAIPVDVMAHALPSAATEGQIVTLNVNAGDFCERPDVRTARIVAVTTGAIVLADVNNPPNGFTDDEYRAFGVALDTLVTPVDTAAFGAPYDIDRNGRVGIFFTRGVNELTQQGSNSVVLGFYYLRDLLPRKSPYGDCPGSNVGEMFYVMVPDPSGSINGNSRSKSFVADLVVGAISHEYQHLINASRRMYVTDALRVDEEVWLNEGLSHIAEELVFYRGSGLTPRSNIGSAPLAAGSPARTAFDAYNRSNVVRYREYQRSPAGNSPMADNDNLATRGATWSFLRYLVDRVRTTDGDFWRKLVNARTTGAVNLDSVLAGTGVTSLSALRDWSTSVMMDDIAVASPGYQQLSWDFVGAMQVLGGGQTFALNTRVLTNRISSDLGLVGGGSSYLRFVVPQNQEALLRVTAFGGGPLPVGIKLSIVRIK